MWKSGLIAFLTMLLVGCGGDDDSVVERRIPAGGIWYESDFEFDTAAAARHHHTVVLDLEPTRYLGEPLENTVRYELDAGKYRFCIDPKDEYITGFTLENDWGEGLLMLDRFSECAELELPAGIYPKRIRHDGDVNVIKASALGEKPLSRVAFVQATNTPRITNTQGEPRLGWWALQVVTGDSSIRVLSVNRGDASTQTLSKIGNTELFFFMPSLEYFIALGDQKGGELYQQFMNHGFTIDGIHIPGLKAPVTAGLHGELQLRASDSGRYKLIAYRNALSTDCSDQRVYLGYQGGFIDGCPAAFWTISDLGAYEFQWYIKDDNHPRTFISTADDRIANFDGVHTDLLQQDAAFEQHNQPTTFRVLFRFYRPQEGFLDTSKVVLQEGEVALFEQCNYGGKMWVFAVDAADFSLLSAPANDRSGNFLDDAISAVKVGPNTAVELFSEAHFSGDHVLIASNAPCLDGAGLASKTASSLKFVPDVKAFLISSKSCIGCKLAGVQLQGADLSDVDLKSDSNCADPRSKSNCPSVAV